MENTQDLEKVRQEIFRLTNLKVEADDPLMQLLIGFNVLVHRNMEAAENASDAIRQMLEANKGGLKESLDNLTSSTEKTGETVLLFFDSWAAEKNNRREQLAAQAKAINMGIQDLQFAGNFSRKVAGDSAEKIDKAVANINDKYENVVQALNNVALTLKESPKEVAAEIKKGEWRTAWKAFLPVVLATTVANIGIVVFLFRVVRIAG